MQFRAHATNGFCATIERTSRGTTQHQRLEFIVGEVQEVKPHLGTREGIRSRNLLRWRSSRIIATRNSARNGRTRLQPLPRPFGLYAPGVRFIDCIGRREELAEDHFDLLDDIDVALEHVDHVVLSAYSLLGEDLT